VRARTDLHGKVAVVTGAARGIGASCARQLAERGARVALLGLEPGELERVAAMCPGSAWWKVDVTDAAALELAAAAVVERFGGVDVLVVNAGIATGGQVLRADVAAYERVIEVNLLGSIRTVRAFLRHLIERKGYVLQVASMAAFAPAPFMSAYCASKAGVESFAHALRVEMIPYGVDVGVAYLSWTDTDMVRGADETPGIREIRASLPAALRKAHPVEPAVRNIVDGITRRSPHVYAQRGLRVLSWLRGGLPALVARVPRQRLAEADEALRAAGADATKPVGAGGAADAASLHR
jgi:NAD(P)-dependent dehydrogenase (short-subunit alcohol dehydrogenase family)